MDKLSLVEQPATRIVPPWRGGRRARAYWYLQAHYQLRDLLVRITAYIMLMRWARNVLALSPLTLAAVAC